VEILNTHHWVVHITVFDTAALEVAAFIAKGLNFRYRRNVSVGKVTILTTQGQFDLTICQGVLFYTKQSTERM